MSNRRRWGRRILWGLLGLLGLVLLAVGGLLLFVTSPAGEDWLRGKVSTALEQQLAGRLEIGDIDLGLGTLGLSNLKLYDPEGALVAEVAHVQARVVLGAAVRGKVVVPSARIEKPRLYLVQDSRGLNLSRALKPKQPKPEPPQEEGRGNLQVEVRELVLEDGHVEYELEMTDGVFEALLENFDARAHATYAAATQSFDAAVDATGALQKPTQGPVKLSLKGQGQEETLSGDVSLSAAGLELEASATLPGPNETRTEIRRLRLPPELVRALVPSYPLQVPVTAQGTLGLSGEVAQLAVDARAASASLAVNGAVDFSTMRTPGLTAKARGINLSELVENGPPTSLSMDLEARGGGSTLESLDADVALTVTPSQFKNQPLGPLELRASAKEGRFSLSRLLAVVPGASLTAKGEGTLDDVRVTGSLTAGNLATLAQTVGRLGPGEALPLSGKGALDFILTGPARSPGVKLSGDFVSLAYAGTVLEGLSLKAKLPDVTQPFSTDATLVVSRLRTGGRTFHDVAATLSSDPDRALKARVRVQGDAQLALALDGAVDEDGQGLAIRDLTLAWPEATWKLQRPTRVELGEGVRVAPALSLASGEQSLALALDMRGERLELSADTRAVDLARLPRLFVPESLGLGGVLSGHVEARGSLPRPDATVDLTLTDGRYQEYQDWDLALKGTYARDRARGTFSAQGPGASASADFNVPVQGLLRRRREPVELKVTLANMDIGSVLKAARRPEPYRGQLTGSLSVTGSAREPQVAVQLQGEQMRYEAPLAFPLPQPLAFTLRGGTDANDGTLDARLDVQGGGTKAFVALRTPFTTGQLLARPPTPAELMEAPVTLEARLDDLTLAPFAEATKLRGLGGVVSMRLEANGSAVLPAGRLEVNARGFTANGTPPLDGRLALAAGGPDVRVELTTHQRGQLLAQLTAVLDAPLAALQDRDVIGQVPFRIEGRAGPVPITEIPLLARTDPAKGLQGILALELAARGTLETPQVDLTAGLQKLGVGELALGQARLHYRYGDARSVLDALLTAPSGGTLLLRGGVEADLSLPAVQRGLETERIPLEVTLVARDFDMGFLSGSTEMVRTLGGVLQADARLEGTVGKPVYQGELEWQNGRLGLMGLGEYRDIHVALTANQKRFQLEELFARSGAGELKLTADAVLTRGGDFSLTGQMNAKDFPIIFDDQLLAITTLRAQVQGDVSNTFVHLRNLSIPEAHIVLPEVRRKDLQPLDRPTDIVLVRNGEPVERRKRKQLQQQREQQARGQGPQASSDDKPPADDRVATQERLTEGTGGSKLAGDPGEEEARRDRGEPEPEEEAQAAVRRYLVNVNAPRNIWVRGSDVNVELGLSEDFRIEYDEESRLYGEVTVLRGRVDVLGRRFDVQRDSQVRFTGPARTPYINVTAEHRNEREGITVFVTIRGQGKEFTIKPTADPPLPESEIYTLLATGRRTLRRGSGASMTGTQQAASIVGSLLASQARKALAEKLPLDVFSIEAVEGGLAGALLEVGTYVTDQIYVGYTGRVGATAEPDENANAVRLEYQFSPRWGLEAECGDAPACGFDLIWGREY